MTTPREMMNKTLSKAKVIDNRHKTGVLRLESFPLWKRIVFYTRFNGIRNILQTRALLRANLTLMSIGMLKTIKRLEKSKKRGYNYR